MPAQSLFLAESRWEDARQNQNLDDEVADRDSFALSLTGQAFTPAGLYTVGALSEAGAVQTTNDAATEQSRFADDERVPAACRPDRLSVGTISSRCAIVSASRPCLACDT